MSRLIRLQFPKHIPFVFQPQPSQLQPSDYKHNDNLKRLISSGVCYSFTKTSQQFNQ